MRLFEKTSMILLFAGPMFFVVGCAEGQKTSSNWGYYALRGLAYSREGQYEHAISEYSKAIEIDPTYAETYFNRGNAYLEKGQHDQTISDCSKAIELDPKDAVVNKNRGISCFFKREYEKAWEDVHKEQNFGYGVSS